MAVTVDTAAVAPRERFDYWSEAQARLFFALDVRAASERPFSGRAVGHELGPVRVRRVAAEGHRVRRTPRAIAADDPEQFQLSLMLAGTQELAQEDRAALLGPGDLVCMDSSRPYAVCSPDPFEMLVFAVPKALLRPHVDRVGGRTASAMRAGDGLSALVAPFLRSVGDGLLDGTVSEDDRGARPRVRSADGPFGEGRRHHRRRRGNRVRDRRGDGRRGRARPARRPR